MVKIKVRRGFDVNLPTFDEGEPGFTTDTKRVFFGSDEGNIEIATKKDIDNQIVTLDEHKVKLDQNEIINGISVMDKQFSVKGNANYFDAVTAKWYEDSTFLVEAADDTEALKAVHDFANENKLKVKYPPRKYLLSNLSSIIDIKTSTDFGLAEFIIDEAYSSESKWRYRVKSFDDFSGVDYQTLDLTQFNLPTLIGKINRKSTVISEFAPYANSYFIIEDSTNNTGIRSGSNADPGDPKVEVFGIEEGGRVVGDISQDFTNITSIRVKNAEKDWLIIEGGKFYLTGTSNPGLLSSDYPYAGFTIRRCRTIIRNQYVGLLDGNSDIQQESNNGFYNVSSASDIIFENLRLLPRINEGNQGTYAMSFSKSMNITMKNVRGEADSLHWGIYAPNNIKNLVVDDCDINRVDTHFWCWNVDIRNSNVGMKGISFTGGGRMNIKDSTVMGNQIVDFRNDYGAFWDGDINIDNVTLFPFDPAAEIHLLQWDQVDYDYKIRTPIARSVSMRNVTVDYRYITAPFTQNAFILYMPTFGKRVNGNYRTEFPNEIILDNIRVVGNNRKNFNIGHIPKPQDLKVYDGRSGGIDGNGTITTNCTIRIKDIDCQDFGAVAPTESSRSNMSFLINVDDTVTYSNDSVIPNILIDNCGKIFVSFKASLANVVIRNCVVNCFDNLETGGRTKILFDNCLFQPNTTTNTRVYYVYGKQTFFSNCIFDTPKLNGVVDSTLDYGIISWDTFVRGNMSNCRCTESYYALKSPAVDFMAMIANGTIQRDSEGDYRAYKKTIGTTAQRPTGITAGFSYFDTTLGKPVYYSGTGTIWKDAVGTTA